MHANMGDMPTFSVNSLMTSNTSGVPVSDSAYTYTIADATTKTLYSQQPNWFDQQKAQPMSPPVIMKNKLRVVRVFLVDPDERIPVDQRILHRSDELTTDATDQELYFGIQVQDLLKAHNAMRVGIKWKEEGSKGEAEPLKEIRIRDLVMSVTTIAEFQGRSA